MHESINKAIVTKELAFWRSRLGKMSGMGTWLKDLADSDQSFFLMEIRGNEAIILPSRHYRSFSVIDSPNGLARRAIFYRDFISYSLKSQGVRIDTFIGINLDDTPQNREEFPTFAFQKKVDHHNILLPDIDFLINNFYRAATYKDTLEFDHKESKGVFVGATTGALVTKELVSDLLLPRLRAAHFFKESDRVNFKLPVIVQTENDEVADMIKALGIGGSKMTWNDQFKYKFIVSIDGNGATCSRVAIALQSNCALIKYDSDSELFYFNQMKPWTHYVPAHSDQDVLDIVAAEDAEAGLFREISENGKKFFKQNLQMVSLCQYTSKLISEYATLLNSSDAFRDISSDYNIRSSTGVIHPDVLGDLYLIGIDTHLANYGTASFLPGSWAGDLEGGRSIQGFTLHCESQVAPSSIQYRTYDDFGPSEWQEGEAYCGTVGENRSICGFAIRLLDVAYDDYHILYRGAFSDGHVTPTFADGTPCQHPARLIAMRVALKKKEYQGEKNGNPD